MFLNCGVEKILGSLSGCKEIKPVNSKGNQSWIFIGRTDAEAEAPILWPPDMKNWLIWKDPGAGKDWRQEEKGATEDEMVGWQSLTQWTWVWVNPGSWWWTGRPGVLQSMGLQTVGHDIKIREGIGNLILLGLLDDWSIFYSEWDMKTLEGVQTEK